MLCHEVLGLVDDPAAALASIATPLRPGGALSLLVSQRHAAVLAPRDGRPVRARRVRLLDGRRPRAERRFTAEEVTGLLGGRGFTVAEIHAVRVFADLVPSTLLDLEPGAVAGLLDLERAVADRARVPHAGRPAPRCSPRLNRRPAGG